MTLLGVASGWVFLGEAADSSTKSMAFVAGGASLCAAGVLLLGCKESLLAPKDARPPAAVEAEWEESEARVQHDEEEEAAGLVGTTADDSAREAPVTGGRGDT